MLLEKLADSDNERLAAEVLLATGARWGEVAALEQRRVHHCRITYSNTKNSKNRTVPVSEALFKKSRSGAGNWYFRRWIIRWYVTLSKRLHPAFLMVRPSMHYVTRSPATS